MFKKFSRRRFAKLAGFSALGMAATPVASEESETKRAPDRQASASFPTGFLWGTATSAYQIEGAVNEDGRGRSIWDTFAHTPGKIADHSNADRANDHYHRYKEDVGLIGELGAKAYRFSIAWPRVFPEGTGAPNPKGIDFYDRLVDELLKNGIEPYATLYHWDLPQPLQDKFGGWQSSETSRAFANYAGYVAERLSDRVKIDLHGQRTRTVREFRLWLRHRRARAQAAAGGRQSGPPPRRAGPRPRRAGDPRTRARRHQGRAGREHRGLPAGDRNAGEHPRRRDRNPRIERGLPRRDPGGQIHRRLSRLCRQGRAEIYRRELKIICTPVDFVGLNIYAPQFYVVATDRAPGFDVLPFPQSFPHMESEWLRIGPETAYWVPRLAAKVWNIETIYISENGTSSTDKLAADGKVYDLDRIMYLRNYLTQLQRATSEGVPVRGYFLWSLMDNFEWIFGFEKRFGLYHVDFDTLARTPKLSVAFYRDVVARNAIGA